MPFRESSPLEERIALFREHETGVFSVSELCNRYGISRETFYIWKRRRESGEAGWFVEKSHAAGCCPHATEGWLIATRRQFPHFGPKKVKARLERQSSDQVWSAASTIGDILKRAGLVETRRRRRRALAQGELVASASVPNDEWSIDFKGWFRTRDGVRCDPLTITDVASRYLIEVRIVEPTWAGVRGALERVFEHVGLPGAIRSDNGTPFGSIGAGFGVGGVVAAARPRAAVYSAIEPAGQRPPRADAPHIEGRDVEAGRSNRCQTAKTIRPLSQSLQRTAAA